MNFLSNFGISMLDLIIILSILGLSVIVVAFGQVYWLMRILVSSYIALALVLIMPNKLIVMQDADLIYFIIFTIIIAIFSRQKLFNAINWSGGKFNFGMILFAFSVLVFFLAVVCHFVGLKYFGGILTQNTYHFLVEYFFYIALAPIIFALFFAKKL
jgi:hypothetical protein